MCVVGALLRTCEPRFKIQKVRNKSTFFEIVDFYLFYNRFSLVQNLLCFGSAPTLVWFETDFGSVWFGSDPITIRFGTGFDSVRFETTFGLVRNIFRFGPFIFGWVGFDSVFGSIRVRIDSPSVRNRFRLSSVRFKAVRFNPAWSGAESGIFFFAGVGCKMDGTQPNRRIIVVRSDPNQSVRRGRVEKCLTDHWEIRVNTRIV